MWQWQRKGKCAVFKVQTVSAVPWSISDISTISKSIMLCGLSLDWANTSTKAVLERTGTQTPTFYTTIHILSSQTVFLFVLTNYKGTMSKMIPDVHRHQRLWLLSCLSLPFLFIQDTFLLFWIWVLTYYSCYCSLTAVLTARLTS